MEDLYEKFRYFLDKPDALQHHVALTTMFKVFDVDSRADLKSDLLQEMERQRQTFVGYRAHPNVQGDVLDEVVREIEDVSSALNRFHGKTGQVIRDNEWLKAIAGHIVKPGGLCEFDMPSFYAWQQKSAEERHADITTWFEPIFPLFRAIDLVLKLLRDSGSRTRVIAPSGAYQQKLQGKVYQMVRIQVDPALQFIPEVSANPHVLWVRFTSQDKSMRLSPVEEDVPFELTLC
jgi:cell division protein ZapD